MKTICIFMLVVARVRHFNDDTHYMSKIIIGMSGGVDSSVSALLLKEQGLDVHGVFMKNWQDDDEHCTAKQDADDAQAVCKTLNIPFSIINFSAAYWDRVFTHFLDEYNAGRTPNPDILCNQEIKFKAFLNYALEQGAEFIATGHYAQIKQDRQGFQLLKGLDPLKDQSYFLYTLGEHALSKTLFPVGSLEKSVVRDIAARAGLINAHKKDSTGICFIGERKFKTFLQEFLPNKPGRIETLSGDVLGRHDGLMYYTLGQRKGINIGGLKQYKDAPWYVLQKDVLRNVLVVGQEENHPALFRTTLKATQLCFSGALPQARCAAKIRYRQEDQACSVSIRDDATLSVTFDKPQRAITPGQSIVFYDQNVCVGGGVIV